MKRALASLLLSWTAMAQSAPVVYQGYLTDAAFAPVDGATEMEFRLYADATGGTPLWIENLPAVPVSAGFFAVELGLDASDLVQDDLFLAIEIAASGDELQPRRPVGSAPWALLCADAASVAGQAAATLQQRVSGTCSGDGTVRAIMADGSVACETDDVGAGAVTSVGAGSGLSVTPGSSVVVDLNAGSGLIAGTDDVALDFSGSSGSAPLAARVDHGHFQYVPAGGSLSCPPGQQMIELDPTGNVFCDPDVNALYAPGPSGNIVSAGMLGVDFQLANTITLSQLTAANYFLQAPRLYSYPIPAAAFHGKQSGTGYYSLAAVTVTGFLSCPGCEDEVLAEMDLPRGAMIESIDIVHENGSFGAIQCWLHVITLATRAATTYDLGAVPPGAPGLIATTTTPVSPPPVDNQLYSYVAECYLYENTDPAETKLYTYRVNYTLTQLVQ